MAIPGIDLARWTGRVRVATNDLRHKIRAYDYNHKPLQMLREDLYFDYKRLVAVEADLSALTRRAFQPQSPAPQAGDITPPQAGSDVSGSAQTADSSSTVSGEASTPLQNRDDAETQGSNDNSASQSTRPYPEDLPYTPVQFWDYIQTLPDYAVIDWSDYVLTRTNYRELKRDELECEF